MEEYPYTIVPKVYRERIYRKPTRNFQPIENQMILDLFAGKTILVDAQIPIDKPVTVYSNLYGLFAARGYRLFRYLIDDVDKNIFRGLLLWAEPLVSLWSCSRCGDFEIASEGTKPQTQDCESKYRFHSWRKVEKMHKKRVRDEVAA